VVPMLPDEDIDRIAGAVVARIEELRRVDEIARAVLARSYASTGGMQVCPIPEGGPTNFTCDGQTNYVCQEFQCQATEEYRFDCRGQGQQEFYCQVTFGCVPGGNQSERFDCNNFTCAGAEGAQEYVCPVLFGCGAADVNFRCGLQTGDTFVCAVEVGTFQCTVPGEAGDFVCSGNFTCGGEHHEGDQVFTCARPDPFACAEYECNPWVTFTES